MVLDLIGILGAGALTFLTPCVLPLVPIYLSALVGGDFRQLRGGGSRGQLVLRAAWFSFGFLGVFTLLGLAASSLGTFLAAHRAEAQALGAFVIGLFALKFLGVVQIPWLDRTLRPGGQRLAAQVGWLHAFLMGLVFAAGWSPCVGPVLGSVLTYTASATASPLQGALYLAVYGLGFSLPLIGVALFAEAGSRLLLRLSAHLRKVELALGALLLLVAGSMVLDALPAPSEPIAPRSTPAAAPAAQPSLTAFVSSDCPVCHRMQPVIQSLVESCGGDAVRIVDVSSPANRAEVAGRRLVGVPTFLFETPEGREAARLVGEQSEEVLRQTLSALRGEPCPGLTRLPPPGGPLPVACKAAPATGPVTPSGAEGDLPSCGG